MLQLPDPIPVDIHIVMKSGQYPEGTRVAHGFLTEADADEQVHRLRDYYNKIGQADVTFEVRGA